LAGAWEITLSRLDHVIDLNLSKFDRVSVDAEANTLTIGGAVRFKDILEPLGRAQKELRKFSNIRP
jgi:CO/xanthine dehydrogenase FAD-binding subunit